MYTSTKSTLIKKLAVINYLAVVRKMRATIEHFYPNLAATDYNSKRTTILRWARNRNKLVAAAAAGRGEHKKVRNRGVATILSAENETEIAQWVDELRGDGIPVSTQMLTDKALDVVEKAEVKDVKASDKWVAVFKRRHLFSLRCPTRQSQLSPANLDEIAADFAAEVDATVRNLGIKRVYTADQTGNVTAVCGLILLLM
ncbi:hypothetical protein PHYSODRAFT_526109 [Phytophthora sojae]|uniref:HTH CENPB-type domain-containing protein n=1 Tax=Phytophthora sojae (strain P6497) TaxID=1094619 RepID=G5A9C6_PHYSP|nr:hypothetical protein PHYSODRAFT_526109 [Phytophthora sojae]EGZ08502.1 hypothetical protein PHYSODRAFT_526109 [Phytophthora sojae]|eukprot:XP_009536674.1 hypothetical protein PHYSODRAFT_526109 [Phytophthora sojae]